MARPLHLWGKFNKCRPINFGVEIRLPDVHEQELLLMLPELAVRRGFTENEPFGLKWRGGGIDVVTLCPSHFACHEATYYVVFLLITFVDVNPSDADGPTARLGECLR